MSLTRQEVIDYASRYVGPSEIADFPFNGDLFGILGRKLPESKTLALDEGWHFQGYGICWGYTVDAASKPAGKWLWMHFASLSVFPPQAQAIKLQPPHIVKGLFQDPTRTQEFRIIKVDMTQGNISSERNTHPSKAPLTSQEEDALQDDYAKGKIVKFRKKNI